ncbi:MAG: hypothetical protein ABIT38_09050 [Gemmatimonadaceae bacterium]
MMRYKVFGGVLDAPFTFPELREADSAATPDWELHLTDSALELTSALAARRLGREELAEGIFAELHRDASGLRISYDDSGTFDISARGRSILWCPREGCDQELARVDILGRVFSLALHEEGMMTLHGSGVSLPVGAVGFLASKGSGKSTLAMTLVARGARLMTDDTFAISPTTLVARPGVHSVRLWDDSAKRFSAMGESRLGLSDKRTFDVLPNDSLQDDPRPLAALYELIPEPRDSASSDAPARRVHLDPPSATIALMRHSKLGALLGGAEAMEVFDRCAAIAARIPVYSLYVTRDISAIDVVASTIAGWHV